MSQLTTKLNVLLVEDNRADIRLIEEYCSRAGGFCITNIAKDGEEALETLNKLKNGPAESIPDIIILDLNLPKIGGIEVLEDIRKDEILKLIPVIVFSSSLNPKDVDMAYKLGANVFMEKPFDEKTYEAVMERMWKFWAECVIKIDWHFVKQN